jgi:hypothetical protein
MLKVEGKDCGEKSVGSGMLKVEGKDCGEKSVLNRGRLEPCCLSPYELFPNDRLCQAPHDECIPSA